jgi:hypothetical protein
VCNKIRHGDVTVEFVEVGPDLAHKWLVHNTHNRNIRDTTVTAYASDMADDEWPVNGDTVRFAADGTVLDGQHRLLAIIESNTTVVLLVVRGLPDTTQETMDGGVKRKFSDVLTLRGESCALELAAVVRQVNLWEVGARRKDRSIVPTVAQLSATLEKYPWLRDVARESRPISHGCGLPGSVVGLCWWLFTQLDPGDCKDFFEKLRTGEYMGKGQPIYELRRVLAASTETPGDRSSAYLTAITIKSWNAYREGRSVGLLRFRLGGANPEKFPEPK